LTYAEWLRDKSPQIRPTGWTHATHDQVLDGYDADGKRTKTVLDQLGNEVHQYGKDQQDVRINIDPPTIDVPASLLPAHLKEAL
jgi:hypothetical protein